MPHPAKRPPSPPDPLERIAALVRRAERRQRQHTESTVAERRLAELLDAWLEQHVRDVAADSMRPYTERVDEYVMVADPVSGFRLVESPASQP